MYVGHRGGSDPELLWLWCSLTAVALIQPLARELPFAVGVALKKTKKKKKSMLVKEALASLRISVVSIPFQIRHEIVIITEELPGVAEAK